MKKFYNFHIPRDRYSGSMVTWCYDNFGKPMPAGRSRWDSYQHTKFVGGNQPFINGRMFIFYHDEDAMAFKLRWI